MCNKSESIAELAKALIGFNSEITKISKDANNPFFKNNYATLDNIVDEVRPILAKHGLSILQFPGGDGENVIMKTMLLHESGEWIESEPLVMKPVKNDPQAVGSCVTYARRYSIGSFLSLNTGEDDDGNKASQPKTPQQVGQDRLKQEQYKANQRNPVNEDLTAIQNASQQSINNLNSEAITPGQGKMFWVRSKQAGFDSPDQKEIMWELLSAHLAREVSDIAQLQKSEFNGILKWFEEKMKETVPS